MDEKEKIEAILEVCNEYAYDAGDCWIISTWELSWHLDNWWYSPLFFKEWELKRYKISKMYESQGKYAIPFHMLDYLTRRVKRTLEKIEGVEINKRRNSIWFKIPKQVRI